MLDDCVVLDNLIEEKSRNLDRSTTSDLGTLPFPISQHILSSMVGTLSGPINSKSRSIYVGKSWWMMQRLNCP